MIGVSKIRVGNLTDLNKINETIGRKSIHASSYTNGHQNSQNDTPKVPKWIPKGAHGRQMLPQMLQKGLQDTKKWSQEPQQISKVPEGSPTGS